MTARDPWVNMLRTTVACFAAGVGGADVVTVQPFDAALGPARRLLPADRPQHAEPAGRGGHLARVARPGRGLLVRRALTDELARAAWDWFTEIERAGGLPPRWTPGSCRADRRHLGARARATRHRADAITGVSEFPNLAETAARARRRAPTVRRPAGCRGCGTREAFEELRDRRPPPEAAEVYLATIGPVAKHTARASLRRQPVPGGRARDAVRRRRGRLRRGAATTVACICGPTRTTRPRPRGWPRSCGPPAPPRSGWPASRTSPWTGSDGYVFSGCDALEVLRTGRS